MTFPLRTGLAAAFTLLLALAAKADILISDFNTFSTQLFPPMQISWYNGAVDQYTQGAGFISITSVSGGDPKGDGYFIARLPGSASLDFTGVASLSINTSVDAGNASSIFHVLLFDNTLTQAAVGTFSGSSFTSSFSTQSSPIVLFGGGNIANITYWRIDGDGIASNSFRYSFSHLTAAAVPEPSAYAVCAAGLLGTCIVRRELRKRRPLAG